MLNRIRRALRLARVRHSSEAKHERPLTPSRPPTRPGAPALADEPTVILARAVDGTGLLHSPPDECPDLVRPYVLAWERIARQRQPVVVAPHLPTEAWSALQGTR